MQKKRGGLMLDLAEASEEVAIKREQEKILKLVEKYPEFFAQQEDFAGAPSFPGLREYFIWLCKKMEECPNGESDLFKSMQEHVNLNKGFFRVEGIQSIGTSLMTVTKFLEHEILLTLKGGGECRQVFLCVRYAGNQEICRYYEDDKTPEYRCKFFDKETDACTNARAIDETIKKAEE
ncbi:MAG: hypothetical protein ACD_8C00124G0001 [uncultured bacterium]|nr:MAG: hypothetical protein ACD_8C00124G0001 [uncultured bacterium]